jgi:hypothetical protein
LTCVKSLSGKELSRVFLQKLGLGVLEEPNTEGSDELSTENDGSYPSDNEPGPSTTSPRTHRDSNVLDKLMGKKAKSKRPAIEEMED